ncbi:alpha/beta hydrolase [Patescibacteria group bacterium]|nr:alpha/beta hydrolase [Patescibacteria group bacterium]
MEVKIRNSAGKNLAAVIHCPETQTEQLAILCPGYLDTKDYSHLIELSKSLAKDGYTVVRFDPTGIWESEGDISDYLTSQYLDDVKSVLEYMLSQHEYTHVLLGGHSRGGMVSILYAAQDPRISLVLGIMPSSELSMTERREKEWRENGFSLSQRDIPGTTQQKEFRVPYSHVIDRNKFNVVEAVKNVYAPIVLIAGELDDVVSPADVKEIFNQANEPKKFILMKGIGHDYRHNQGEVSMVNQVITAQIN